MLLAFLSTHSACRVSPLSFLLSFVSLILAVESTFHPMPLDFLWVPVAPNGSNVTEFACQCFSYMDAVSGRCLPSSILNTEESMAAELQQSPQLSTCSYKRVILGQRVIIRCPFRRNESLWTSLGRWNMSNFCVESPGNWCGQSDRLVITQQNELVIDPIFTQDPGVFECVALDSKIFRIGIIIDYDTALYGQLVYSSIAGSIAATSFLAIALSAHFLRVLIEYCRRQEMNKHVQWVIDFVSRQQYQQHQQQNGGKMLQDLPVVSSNGGIVIIGEEPEDTVPDVAVIKAGGGRGEPQRMALMHRNWGTMPTMRIEQLAAVRMRASQQMERIKARYNERAHRVRTQCGSQMDQLHQRYHDKLSKMKDYSSNRYVKIRVRYSKKRKDLHNYANMKMSLIRDNYQMQRKMYLYFLTELENMENI